MSEPQVQEDVVTDEAVQNQPETETQVETEAEETDDQSPDAEQDNEPEKTVEQRLEELEKDRESKQKTIDRKTAAYSALNKKHEATLQRLQEIESKLQTEEPLKEPVLEDFETLADYHKARDEFVEKRTERAAQEKYQKEQLQKQRIELARERERIRVNQESEYIRENPDYPESKAEFEAFIGAGNFPPQVESAVVQQAFKGNVAQIIDYFGRNGGENLDKLESISAMTPIDAAIEIYKIQQSLKAPQKLEKKPAPPPVSKPKGGGKPRKDPSEGDVLKNLGLK